MTEGFTKIPYGRQDVRPEDIAAVVEVLRSDWLTQGPVVPRFESAVANYCGASYGVAVNSATSALHLACQVLGLGPSDWLWTTPNTFVASANCALYCGARVDFVDIDPVTYNFDPVALKKKLEQAERAGRLPKIVVPVHFAGQSCDMVSIHKLGKQYGFRIIEDASHAIGGSFQGQHIGNCRYSDITVFSFHPVKIITTGEGGMAVCNASELAARMLRLRGHGITREPADMQFQCDSSWDGPWCYQQVELGANYRLTDIQAALGLSQLDRLNDYVKTRQQLAARYDRLLTKLPLQIPRVIENAVSTFHLYVVLLDDAKCRRQVFDYLRAAGIGVNVHYIPIHLQPHYRNMGFEHGQFPVAEDYYSRAITLPLYPALTEHQQDKVITSLETALASL